MLSSLKHGISLSLLLMALSTAAYTQNAAAPSPSVSSDPKTLQEQTDRLHQEVSAMQAEQDKMRQSCEGPTATPDACTRQKMLLQNEMKAVHQHMAALHDRLDAMRKDLAASQQNHAATSTGVPPPVTTAQ